MEKPPVLSERQFEDWCKARQKQVWDRFEAQRDADVEWYEVKLREIFEEIGKKSHKAPAYSIVKNTDIKIPENPSMIVRDADWQSLQSKFLEGK